MGDYDWSLLHGYIGIPDDEDASLCDKAMAIFKEVYYPAAASKELQSTTERAKNMKLYIAAPVVGVTSEVQNQIFEVCNLLQAWESDDGWRVERGYDIYRPGAHKIPNAWGMSMQEWARCVFTVDVLEIDKADWIVVCDFGRHNTAGTSWEAGYAFGKEKKILVVKMPGVEEQSLMVQCCGANTITYEELMALKRVENIDYIFTEKGRSVNKGTVLN